METRQTGVTVQSRVQSRVVYGKQESDTQAVCNRGFGLGVLSSVQYRLYLKYRSLACLRRYRYIDLHAESSRSTGVDIPDPWIEQVGLRHIMSYDLNSTPL